MRNREQFEGGVGDELLDRREILQRGVALAGATSLAFSVLGRAAAARAGGQRAMDAKSEAKKIAFDRSGKGDKVLLISGFPQTRRSWNRLVPLLSRKFETMPADLLSFGDSGILDAPATTENAGRVFHEFVTGLGTPLHVVAHDFGAWVAYSWALLFKEDFKSLTLIEAGIPGVTLLNDIELSDYKRKWNFIFQMLPDMPAELTKGKEDVYVGWWFKNKVYKPGAIPQEDVDAYVHLRTHERGAWTRLSTTVAKSSKTWSSIRSSSRANCLSVSWQSGASTPFRTWETRCGLISSRLSPS